MPLRLPKVSVLLALLTAPLALAACGPSYGEMQPEAGDEIREFRESHIECSNRFFRRPCQIGPDGKLYRYNPGETGYGDKN